MSKKTELMHWDCAMEEMAEAAAKDCPTTPAQPTIPGGNDKFGLVFESTNVKGKECNPVTKTDTLIKTWWKEGAKKQEDQKRVQDNDKFAQMAYSESSGLGCTYQTCGRQLYVLCLYGQDAVTKVNAQGDLYPATQQESELCNQCGNNAAGQLQCADALCNPPYTPSNVYKKKLKLALPVNRFRLRRLLATGWAKDKKIKYAKPASKMNALVYDKDLEDAAFTYVTANQNDCPTKQEKDIGENFWSGTYTLTEEEAMKEIAHDETKKIGCAAKSCPPQGITVVDCRYDPAITDSDTIYTAGKMPCKPCPSGTTCSKLGGLCEAPATP
ncbi:SCP-like protein [Ancylostoma ceylanicum]|uniref:SCP-like protein n=1 Tax=Ancylostoma ceylanicum TaxID=53326 RepID=A0A0D6LF31_9BILA|nr:SCP-like protein [Ancylostoma ceylanicum]